MKYRLQYRLGIWWIIEPGKTDPQAGCNRLEDAFIAVRGMIERRRQRLRQST